MNQNENSNYLNISERYQYIITSNQGINFKNNNNNNNNNSIKNNNNNSNNKSKNFKTLKDSISNIITEPYNFNQPLINDNNDNNNSNNINNISNNNKNNNNKNNNSNINNNNSNNTLKSNKSRNSIHLYGPNWVKVKKTEIIERKFSNDLLSKSLKRYNNHKITQSESNLIELDEKISIEKYELLEKKNKNIIYKINTENFDFSFLNENEKFYEQLIKDFNGNFLKNIFYKEKIASFFIKNIIDKNILGNAFKNNIEFNKFLRRELCLLLSILFLNKYKNLSDLELNDYNNCLYYCHINFLFIVNVVVQNFNYINNNNEFNKLLVLIEVNKDRINNDKFNSDFHLQNKLIKNILLNLLTKLNYINRKITKIILDIFNLDKNLNFIDVVNNYLNNNQTILDTINFNINNNINNENEIIENNNINNNLNNNNNNNANDCLTNNNNNTSINNNTTINNNNYILQDNTNIEDSFNIPQPDPPFLPEKTSTKEYTLVLDLDETLVHYCEEDENEDDAYVKVRMGTENFINVLSEYCEIIIFTASTQYYADIVIDGLDCKDKISGKLYRQHTSIVNGFNIKDLSLLGRDLTKTIIIDNIEENYSLQPKNGLNISDFEGDENDNELNYLLEDLLKIVSREGLDVTFELDEVRKNMQKRYSQ